MKPFGVQESRLKLPVKADHIEAVLEYLYADEVRSLATSEDTEFISHVLVVADQFLLIRLKVPYLHRYRVFNVLGPGLPGFLPIRFLASWFRMIRIRFAVRNGYFLINRLAVVNPKF